MKKEADQLFNEGEYGEASPKYSQLLSIYPKNPDYNYRYGVCVLKTNRKDITIPLKYLEAAAIFGCKEEKLNFYMGLAYHYNLKFSQAIESFESYLSQGLKEKTDEVDALIINCKNGQKLCKDDILVSIINKEQCLLSNFHRAYLSADIPGKVLVTPESFQTEADKQRDYSGLIYISGSSLAVFASYGEHDPGNKDIYLIRMMGNGEWGAPERLPDVINTIYDEDFPTISEDGNNLFFCSTGHNSIGGYDIFLSRYDTINQQWNEPVNLDSRINTPFDDILFCMTEEVNNVIFASNRQVTGDNIELYKTKITGIPEKNFHSLTQDKQLPDTIAANVTGDRLVQQRKQASKLADSSFLLVSQSRNKLNNLKDTKDRSFRIANEKQQLSQNRKNEADQTLKDAENITDNNEITEHKNKAKLLLEESAQLEKRSDHANNIGESIKYQIQITENQIEV
ncbi:MAG: hypothetical protein K8R53_02475, partial [Bacteroidales bacterium]|nr:hypothetical protein [Bacteroidales bacterium]